MIKGVSRYAVEIDKTDNPYFEKVICFVRPQYTEGNAVDLHREAERMVGEVSGGVEEAQRGSRHVLKVPPRNPARDSATVRPAVRPAVRPYQPPAVREEPASRQSEQARRNGLPPWVPLALSAGGGAAAAIVIVSLL